MGPRPAPLSGHSVDTHRGESQVCVRGLESARGGGGILQKPVVDNRRHIPGRYPLLCCSLLKTCLDIWQTVCPRHGSGDAPAR